MLIRLTNKCNMHCTHCLSDSHPNGEDMTNTIWVKSIALSSVLEPVPFLFISGGEPTDHPYFINFIRSLCEFQDPKTVLILSNGLFLKNKPFSKILLDLGVNFQITNDKRFYPRIPPQIKHKNIIYIDEIGLVSPFGRAKNNPDVVIDQKAPNCFNLRSAMYSTGDIKQSISSLRFRGYFCSPSINIDGNIVAGEAPECGIIGNVDGPLSDINENLKNLKCDKCKQSKNLSGVYLDLWNKINK